MVICEDTSLLFSLYGNDENTPRAVAWNKPRPTAFTLSSLNEYELGNALRFAEFRRAIGPGEAALFWAEYEADRSSGRLKVQVCNLAEIVDEARRLSATHTLTGGHRGFDILHVAAAIRLKAKQLLTFDGNRKNSPRQKGSWCRSDGAGGMGRLSAKCLAGAIQWRQKATRRQTFDRPRPTPPLP
jgi:predicted nucleic acid-binding protein